MQEWNTPKWKTKNSEIWKLSSGIGVDIIVVTETISAKMKTTANRATKRRFSFEDILLRIDNGGTRQRQCHCDGDYNHIKWFKSLPKFKLLWNRRGDCFFFSSSFTCKHRIYFHSQKRRRKLVTRLTSEAMKCERTNENSKLFTWRLAHMHSNFE